MNALMQAQRKAIQYYNNLLKKEDNPIKKYLLKKNIRKSEKELNKYYK